MTNSRKKNKLTLGSYSSFQKVLNQAGPAANASYSLIASILSFIFIGFYIDDYFDISPAGTIIGMILGLVVGFYQMVKATHYTRK